MKRIVYSAALKFIAVVLFVIVIVNGALTVVDGIIKYSDEDIDIYAFERDFSESWYIMHLLDEPENIIFNAYYSFLPQNGESGSSIDKDKNNITINPPNCIGCKLGFMIWLIIFDSFHHT